MKRSTIIATMILLLLFFLIPTAAATTWEVGTTSELENAFANANSGDTIIIAAGTYAITVPLDVGDRSLTILGAGAGATVIDATSVAVVEFAFGRDNDSATTIDYLVIKDISVRNASQDGIEAGKADRVEISGCESLGCDDSGFDFEEVETLTITSCTAHDNSDDGFDIDDDIGTLTISNCTAHDNGSDGFDLDDATTLTLSNCTAHNNNDGICLDTVGAATLTYCNAYSNDEDGFDLEDTDTSATLSFCSAYDNGDDGFEMSGIGSVFLTDSSVYDNGEDGFDVITLEDSYITNSLAYGNASGGFSIACDSDSTLAITNCTSFENWAGIKIPIYEHDSISFDYHVIGDIVVTNFISAYNDCSFDIRIGDPAVSGGGYGIMDITYSDIWDEIVEAHSYDISPFIGTGVLNSNPLFEDIVAPDLHISDTSPCIDSGINASAENYGFVTDDYDGVQRPSGAAYDMGAYELSQSMIEKIVSEVAAFLKYHQGFVF